MFETTPIINYAFEWTPSESKKFQDELMLLHRMPHVSGKKPVEWVKSKLGRQNYTWVGEYRFWVWESGWRLYVSNTQGISFEVQHDLTKGQVLEQWNDLLSKLGLFEQEDCSCCGAKFRVADMKCCLGTSLRCEKCVGR